MLRVRSGSRISDWPSASQKRLHAIAGSSDASRSPITATDCGARGDHRRRALERDAADRDQRKTGAPRTPRRRANHLEPDRARSPVALVAVPNTGPIAT